MLADSPLAAVMGNWPGGKKDGLLNLLLFQWSLKELPAGSVAKEVWNMDVSEAACIRINVWPCGMQVIFYL